MKQDPDSANKEHTHHRSAEHTVDESDIPVLNETVDNQTGDPSNADLLEEITTLSMKDKVEEEHAQNSFREKEIATLEAIVFDGADPHKLKHHQAAQQPQLTPSAAQTFTPIEPMIDAPHSAKPLPKTSSNPFLPQHILDRLNNGRRNLVEEIAQSGAALDASTALLRSRSRSERVQHSEPATPEKHGEQRLPKSAARQKQLIDDLIEEYLPLLAAELRKRLKAELEKETGSH